MGRKKKKYIEMFGSFMEPFIYGIMVTWLWVCCWIRVDWIKEDCMRYVLYWVPLAACRTMHICYMYFMKINHIWLPGSRVATMSHSAAVVIKLFSLPEQTKNTTETASSKLHQQTTVETYARWISCYKWQYYSYYLWWCMPPFMRQCSGLPHRLAQCTRPQGWGS